MNTEEQNKTRFTVSRDLQKKSGKASEGTITEAPETSPEHPVLPYPGMDREAKTSQSYAEDERISSES